MRIKKGDTVYVRTGQYKGKTGKVLHVDEKKQRVVVEGINMQKKHQRPTQNNQQGGILTIEGSIHISNVALYSSSLSGPTKISTKIITEGDKKRRVRVCRRTGEEI